MTSQMTSANVQNKSVVDVTKMSFAHGIKFGVKKARLCAETLFSPHNEDRRMDERYFIQLLDSLFKQLFVTWPNNLQFRSQIFPTLPARPPFLFRNCPLPVSISLDMFLRFVYWAETAS